MEISFLRGISLAGKVESHLRDVLCSGWLSVELFCGSLIDLYTADDLPTILYHDWSNVDTAAKSNLIGSLLAECVLQTDRLLKRQQPVTMATLALFSVLQVSICVFCILNLQALKKNMCF